MEEITKTVFKAAREVVEKERQRRKDAFKGKSNPMPVYESVARLNEVLNGGRENE